MGAEVFMQVGKGATAQEAFDAAVKEACYEYGHGGYTGSIAEKTNFTLIEKSAILGPYEQADKLIDDGDERIDDKWGPAGCIPLGNDEYLFFGWASS